MSDNEPPYPEARRTYRILGAIHVVLFGGIGFAAGLETSWLWAIAGFVLFGGLTAGVFWRLAEDHYRGNVPGKPGALIYEGGTEKK